MGIKSKQNNSSLLKKIIISAGVIGSLASCYNGDQTIKTEQTFQGYRMVDGTKILFFNPLPRETRDDIKTYIVKGNKNLEIGKKYNIYETPGIFGKRLDSITPYKTH